MTTKYRWLAERLEQMIQKNIRNGIHKMPTEQELCRKYHLSRQTVRMALSLLEQEGLIEKRQGSGSYITGRSSNPDGNTIGILISSDEDYIYPDILNDMDYMLHEKGFSARIFVTDNCVHTEREILSQLLKKPLRGIIAEGCKTALPNPNLDLYRQLKQKGCQIAFLNNYYPALTDCIYIKDDNYYGSALLVQHLASRGHLSIGGIFKSDDMQGIERYQGFAETMNSLSLPLYDHQIGWYNSRDLQHLLQDHNTRFLKEMIQEQFASCTAIICHNDLIAYYLINELTSAGYHLPADMTIAAFNNTYLINTDNLPAITLSHKSREMHYKAVESIINQLNGLSAASQEYLWTLQE
ncbi:MAG: substrate-binding domain-containing protein [Coprococcus sp.]